MEEKLNKLIELGRKPRGIKSDFIEYNGEVFYNDNFDGYSINDLCSIDSGFRKFVVNNKLYKNTKEKIIYGKYEADQSSMYYRITHSALEIDKEKFILDNIKI